MVKNRPKTDYETHTTVDGEVVHVYTPPLDLILGIVPAWPRPQTLMHTMETKAGPQERLAKEGDPGFEDYQAQLKKWRKDREDLQEAAKLVTALRDVKYPNPMVFPPHVQDMIDAGMLAVPEHPYLLKEMYLKATVLEAQHDEQEVNFKIQIRSGVPEEVIDELKSNFRNYLLGEVASTMGDDPEKRDGEPALDAK